MNPYQPPNDTDRTVPNTNRVAALVFVSLMTLLLIGATVSIAGVYLNRQGLLMAGGCWMWVVIMIGLPMGDLIFKRAVARKTAITFKRVVARKSAILESAKHANRTKNT